MPVQQRYTPVPGMGPSGYSTDMLQAGPSGVTMGSASGYSDRNPFETPNSASHSSPFVPSPSSGSLPASRRDPIDDSFPQYDPSQSPYPSNRRSGTGWAGAGAGAGAGTAATIGSGSAMGSSGSSSAQAYQNVPSEQYWPEPSGPTGYTASADKAKRNRLLKWALGILAVLAVIGIVVGVVVSQVTKNKKGGSSNDLADGKSGSGSVSNSGANGANGTSIKNPALHQSFWGFAYTPQGTQPPWCGGIQANVTRDIELLGQLTTRIRLYGANCNTTDLVLTAIQQAGVNMTVWPAIYVDSNETAYNEQLTAITDALQKHGTDNIEGITVGNEYILDTAGSNSNTSAAYLAAEKVITTKVAQVKTTLQGLNLGKTLPVGTSDAGSLMSTTLGAGIDYFMANVHPYFGQVPINDAAAWTGSFFDNFDVSVAEISTGQPETYIAETGWPTQSMDAASANDGAGSPQGDASVANLQTFLDTFVCEANTNGTKYFYFEAFDEPWKAEYGGVEPYWGLFDSNRVLKNITIPSC